MYIDLTGIWQIALKADNGIQRGEIKIPGILQAQGYGNKITHETPWVSGLHDTYWFEREEYKPERQEAGTGVNTPFLSQPPNHFLGKAVYKRAFSVECEAEWYFLAELTHWRTKVWIDGVETGGDCSLCTPHLIYCGLLSAGTHELAVEVDNSMQYPYRPDGHGVSDALGATWNGMAGEVALMTADVLSAREEAKRAYAKANPRHVAVRDGKFYVDGRPEYFRGTHFGGEYPLTGYPETNRAWWDRICETVKEWGLNFIRCHSYCPPEAAFAAADEAGIYIQPECGMWNYFEEGIPMLDVLRSETRRILRQFGHHSSFVLFSPTNEPSGEWYQPLKRWVSDTRAFDRELGYAGRRVYTVQSGWFFDVPPVEITGTDYIYFHRSAYGPYRGGMIRGKEGWNGKDYSPSLEDVQLPVICHEMGQWCAYPDFDVIDKFTGYLQPSNYKVFLAHCKRQGLYGYNRAFAYASGRNQLRLYKEDIEANFRTKELYGFEMLDLHDYLGQGTALVGLLDAFWEQKGYVKPSEFRRFCGQTVLLARFPTYVFQSGRGAGKIPAKIPIEVCHFGWKDLSDSIVRWRITDLEKEHDDTAVCGMFDAGLIAVGKNTSVGSIVLPIEEIKKNSRMELSVSLYAKENKDEITSNIWEFYVYPETQNCCKDKVLYTRDWQEAKDALAEKKCVVFSPRLSDLGYECPPVSMRNVFWNAQMGATWGRSLGLFLDESSALFQKFPTDRTGGWQWEEILEYARGFDISGFGRSDFCPEGVEPLVRVIDDWNRNLQLALIFEVKVANEGRLLVVSADLDFGQEQKNERRYAAQALKTALIDYAASEDFNPETVLSGAELDRYMKKRLFPVYRMEQLVKAVKYPAHISVTNAKELITADPEKAVLIQAQAFPVRIVMEFHRELAVKGLLYVPDQKARIRRGFIKDYELRIWDVSENGFRSVAAGTFLNTSTSQEICVAEMLTDKIELVVLSVYGDKNLEEWIEIRDGYHKVRQDYTAEVKIGALHVLCDESAAYEEVFLKRFARNKEGYKKTEIEC